MKKLTGIIFSVVFLLVVSTQTALAITCEEAGGQCFSSPGTCSSALRKAAVDGTCPSPSQICCTAGPVASNTPYQGNPVPEINEGERSLDAVEEDPLSVNSTSFQLRIVKDSLVGTYFMAMGWPNRTSSGEMVYEGGAVQSVAQYINTMYSTPPATTQTYVADVLDSMNIVVGAEPAYAQGLGFASLSPILPAWKAFRNMAYVFFVVIFLIIGFMIMTGRKMGQTAITVQQAIPKIIVALLAVTFSYAIAGILIDLMYVFMYLLVEIFGGDAGLINASPFTIGRDMIGGLSQDAYNSVGSFSETVFSSFSEDVRNVLQFIGGFTFAVVIGLAMMFSVFSLFFELLKTYLYLVVNIVIAPVVLMMEAVPGRNIIGSWIKSIVGNLIAFPTVLMVLLIHQKIVNDGLSLGGFLPPFLPGRAGASAAVIQVTLGLGLMLTITEWVKQAKKAAGAGAGPFDWFQQALLDSLKKGYRGGELVPGLGITDTTKMPIVSRFMPERLAKELAANAPRKGGIIGAGLTGGLAGGTLAGAKWLGTKATGMGTADIRRGAASGARFARFVADRTNDPHLFTAEREQRQSQKKSIEQNKEREKEEKK